MSFYVKQDHAQGCPSVTRGPTPITTFSIDPRGTVLLLVVYMIASVVVPQVPRGREPLVSPLREEVSAMGHNKTTGKQAASNAGKVLQNPKSTKAEKSAAASALSQVAKHGKKG